MLEKAVMSRNVTHAQALTVQEKETLRRKTGGDAFSGGTFPFLRLV